jgi:hypothetical protein
MNLAEFRDKKVLSEGERIAIYFKDRELTKSDMPGGGSAPLPLHLREKAVNKLIKNSPVKNLDQMATLRD